MKALDGLLIKPIDKFPNDFFKQILYTHFTQFKQINLYHTTKETTADLLQMYYWYEIEYGNVRKINTKSHEKF